MFGMGFGEILIVAVIAIIFLGPDKLPETMVNIAKFFRGVKKTINDTKESIEGELQVSEMKEAALEYKQKLERETSNLYEESTSGARDVKEIFSDLADENTATQTPKTISKPSENKAPSESNPKKDENS